MEKSLGGRRSNDRSEKQDLRNYTDPSSVFGDDESWLIERDEIAGGPRNAWGEEFVYKKLRLNHVLELSTGSDFRLDSKEE